MAIKLEINIPNKILFTVLVSFLVITIAFGVLAAVNKNDAWHGGGQVEVTDPTTSSLTDLQTVLDSLDTKIDQNKGTLVCQTTGGGHINNNGNGVCEATFGTGWVCVHVYPAGNAYYCENNFQSAGYITCCTIQYAS